jgi:hypothetical protein
VMTNVSRKVHYTTIKDDDAPEQYVWERTTFNLFSANLIFICCCFQTWIWKMNKRETYFVYFIFFYYIFFRTSLWYQRVNDMRNEK